MPQSPRIVYSPLAGADLERIWESIAHHSREAADRLIVRFDDAFQILAENPHAGRGRPELADDLRSVPVGNYLLFYRPIEGGIQIVRVIHGARNLEWLFEESDE